MAFDVRPRAVGTVLVGLLAIAAPRAHAQQEAPERAPTAPAVTPVPPGAPAPTAAPLPPAPEPRVEWNPGWRKFHLWEYGAVVGVQALSLYIRWYQPPPDKAKWVGYNPFDDTIRGWLVMDSRSGREMAGLVSDRLAQFGSAVPFAVDLPVVVLGYQQYRLAWHMLWMDFEAIAVANLLNNSAFYLVGRGRPSTQSCANDPTYDRICGGIGNNASFPSGHTVTIATAAGLTCVHHSRMPIFANKHADRMACAVMVAATAATGATRVMADRHFTTDVMFGATIGFGSGWFLPTWLHYGGPRHKVVPETAVPTPRAVSLVPFGEPGTMGLGLVGTL
jgi:membrane-associated phospholipid phosphatase